MRFRSFGKQTVMAVLDSDHSYAHVLAELEAYQHLVTPGSMLIVEDTNVNGNPILPDHGPGPREAVAEFLRRHDTFRVERQWERQLLTFNSGGFLRRIA
jgi:cephalosporin hydroxylase